MNTILKTAVSFLLICFCLAQTNAQIKKISSNPFKGYSTYLNNDLNSQLNDRKDPGVAVSIIGNGKVEIRNLKGVDKLVSNPKLLSPTTSFYLASVTKPITAQLVKELIEDRQLREDDKVGTILPGLPNYMKTVRVKDLLNHQSGISDYYQFITFREPLIDNDYILQLLADSVQTLEFSPGERYSYCNSNYILLARILEKVTGKTYSELIENEIFNTMQMKNASVNDPKPSLRPAVGYNYKEGQFRMNDYKSIEFSNGFVAGFNKRTYGSSGVFASLSDMERWVFGMFSNKYFDGIESNNLTLDQEFESPIKDVTYTTGWFKGSLLGYNVYWHSGEFAGYRNVVVCIPEIEFAIVALSNNGKFEAENTGLKWAHAFVSKMD